MKVNHLHLMVPDLPAYSFHVDAPGGFPVEAGA